MRLSSMDVLLAEDDTCSVTLGLPACGYRKLHTMLLPLSAYKPSDARGRGGNDLSEPGQTSETFSSPDRRRPQHSFQYPVGPEDYDYLDHFQTYHGGVHYLPR